MEVMLDLETFSTRNHATILVIAALKFNRNDPQYPLENMEKFYAKVSVDSCKNVGMHIDDNTVNWWREQKEEVQKEIFGEPREDLKSVLIKFSKWYGNSRNIWSHGATFDIPILSEAYVRCGMEAPWKFWVARDTRTLYDIAGINQKQLPEENLHHALYDCWRQIWGVKEAIKRMQRKR